MSEREVDGLRVGSRLHRHQKSYELRRVHFEDH